MQYHDHEIKSFLVSVEPNLLKMLNYNVRIESPPVSFDFFVSMAPALWHLPERLLIE